MTQFGYLFDFHLWEMQQQLIWGPKSPPPPKYLQEQEVVFTHRAQTNLASKYKKGLFHYSVSKKNYNLVPSLRLHSWLLSVLSSGFDF